MATFIRNLFFAFIVSLLREPGMFMLAGVNFAIMLYAINDADVALAIITGALALGIYVYALYCTTMRSVNAAFRFFALGVTAHDADEPTTIHASNIIKE